MTTLHNGMQCFVARGVASRYLFHTGKSRWVVSKVLDDGYKCWAFVKDDGSSKSPADCQGKWTVCDGDGQWREDQGIMCQAVPASNDKFVQLRLSLDADMKQYGLIETSDLKKLWRRLDYNGNNIVSLAEIDKMVVELTANGVWPSWLNNKPALMRAYKKTILKDGDGDDWVEKKEFHALLLNIFWFNKLWQVFQQVDTGADRRIDVREFTAGIGSLGLNMSPQEAQAEFAKIDVNGGGQVLFVELCAYIRHRVNPDDNPKFDADIISGEDCGRAAYNTSGHHHGHSHSHSHHSHSQSHHSSHGYGTRDIDFAALSASSGAGTMGAPTPSMGAGPRRGRHETLRSCGERASLEHHVKPKALGDFDTLENKIKDLCRDHAKIKGMWHTLDFNGNGIVSLAEIDKWVVENYPLLNHKPALMRCYKCTIVNGSHHDDWVHARDFKKFIVNLFYFNKLYWLFDQANGDDRRMTFQEFKMCLTLCSCQLSDAEAQRDFQSCDKNGGGMILFDEFCHYFAQKACPQGMTEMVDDGFDRARYDGTSSTVRR